MHRMIRICSQLGGLAILFCVVSSAQSDHGTQSSKVDVQRRIAEIVHQRLTEGESTVSGVRTRTRTPPSVDVVNEIKGYGDTAVRILADHLHSVNVRERLVSVELLGLIGGAHIVDPLRGVILTDRSATVRELAVRWLSHGPAELTKPILEQAAKTDPDERVRNVASGILHPQIEKERENSIPFKKQPLR